jgi:D-sedoheptulose 7-phosphate isomerase
MSINQILNKAEKYYRRNNKESLVVKSHMLNQHEDFFMIYKFFKETILKGNKIMFCGNGGSASDAQHLATELTVRFKFNRKAIAALSLVTDSSALTAIGNDFGFKYIFSRQIQALGKKGDCLVCISTSGSSKNILHAAKIAKKMNIRVISFLGKKKSNLEKISDAYFKVPSLTVARIQECHIFLGQTLCGIIEEDFKNRKIDL